METRRAALLGIASAAASTALLPAQHADHDLASDTPAAVQSFQPVYFKQPEYALLSRLVDLIIPATSTPGALAAHVPFRIDHEVALSPKLQQTFKEGLPLIPQDFLSQSEEQQTALLTSMNADPASPGGKFFKTMKDMTVDWYYRSEEGLVQELGFHGNTFRPDFPGCTHPEHWPVAENK